MTTPAPAQQQPLEGDIWSGFTAAPKRDRWGRPYIIPPEGGKPTAYTRVSTLAKALDDQTGLMKWKQRQTALGIARRADLYALLKSTHAEDTRTLNDICEQAMDASESSAAANKGTAIHSFTEAVDNGHDIDVPSEYQADIAAYKKAMEPLDVVMSEQFVVIDLLEAAGSFDRLVRLPNGEFAIGDIKTGKDAPKYANATAAQMACYAHGQFYDPSTGARLPLPDGVRTDFGLLIHLPIGTGKCSIHKIDLDFGWNLAQASVEVRDWRKRKGVASLAWETTA